MKKQSIHCGVLLSLLLLLCSCASKDKAAVQTSPNRGYRPPSVTRPLMRNPDINLSSDLSISNQVTYSRVKTSLPYIAMTFDDGPHPRNTPRLLDMLRKRNIKATFYVVGKNVKMYPGIVRRIVAEGHEIGNHSWSHANFTKISESSVRAELTRTKNAIVAATGVKPRTMRPPYGALRSSQRSWIYSEYGYPTVLWNVDPEDWKRPGASIVASRIVSRTRNGSIVLAHDLHKATVDAMPQALDGLLRRGFKFVTVSQLLALNAKSTPSQPDSPVNSAPHPMMR